MKQVSDILQPDKDVGFQARDSEVMPTGLGRMESVDNGVRRSGRGLRSQKMIRLIAP